MEDDIVKEYTIPLSDDAVEILLELWHSSGLVLKAPLEINMEEILAIVIEHLVDIHDSTQPLKSDAAPMSMSKALENVLSANISNDDLTITVNAEVLAAAKEGFNFEMIQGMRPNDTPIIEACQPGASPFMREAVEIVYNNVDSQMWEEKGMALTLRTLKMLEGGKYTT